ncbi:hypothetical protein [Atopobacter phocae]|uniref:hypothetical protein n=1 Tax=Atopobacter phocae TaxID=136492 RepID=UPI000471EA58|nr:hypothetical protein [Atopobacter phocae]
MLSTYDFKTIWHWEEYLFQVKHQIVPLSDYSIRQMYQPLSQMLLHVLQRLPMTNDNQPIISYTHWLDTYTNQALSSMILPLSMTSTQWYDLEQQTARMHQALMNNRPSILHHKVIFMNQAITCPIMYEGPHTTWVILPINWEPIEFYYAYLIRQYLNSASSYETSSVPLLLKTAITYFDQPSDFMVHYFINDLIGRHLITPLKSNKSTLNNERRWNKSHDLFHQLKKDNAFLSYLINCPPPTSAELNWHLITPCF